MSVALPLSPTRPGWVNAALADLPTLLVDHAHCERKAAQTALKFLAQHPEWEAAMRPWSRLAREELVHFERVLRELASRGVEYRALAAAGYGSALMALRRAPSAPPARHVRSWQGERTVDDMLISAIIEARSHERFVRLAAVTTDRALAGMYEAFLAAEARHGSLYLDLAIEAAGPGGDIAARAIELCAAEDAIIHRAGQPVRMHAGG